jgi:hypothetical protein
MLQGVPVALWNLVMRSGSKDSYEWYEDDVLETSQTLAEAAVAGLPESWWNYDWWITGIAYSGLWLLESWTAAGAVAEAGLIHLVHGFATLLLALAGCYAVLRICTPYSARLGQLVTVVAGTAMLLVHSFL